MIMIGETLSRHQNGPSYITTSIREVELKRVVELKRAMIDLGSSLNSFSSVL